MSSQLIPVDAAAAALAVEEGRRVVPLRPDGKTPKWSGRSLDNSDPGISASSFRLYVRQYGEDGLFLVLDDETATGAQGSVRDAQAEPMAQAAPVADARRAHAPQSATRSVRSAPTPVPAAPPRVAPSAPEVADPPVTKEGTAAARLLMPLIQAGKLKAGDYLRPVHRAATECVAKGAPPSERTLLVWAEVAEFAEAWLAFDPSAKTASGDVRDCYITWAFLAGRPRLAPQLLVSAMRALFGVKPAQGTGGKRLLLGVSIREPEPELAPRFVVIHTEHPRALQLVRNALEAEGIGFDACEFTEADSAGVYAALTAATTTTTRELEAMEGEAAQ